MIIYDLVFLLNEDNELTSIKQLVTSLKGKVLEENKIGEKRLAYPIKKSTTAKMYEWTMELEPSKLEEFKKKLNFNEKLLRYLLLKGEKN
ncbi:MAG: 30S ribosomal protein S6 [Candidatus Levybacteria bacterium]|nr:30S ribosomal protein S6 [Candidatus Levybacteria bacterium]